VVYDFEVPRQASPNKRRNFKITTLELSGSRVTVEADEACRLVEGIFRRLGSMSETARAVAEHLTDASLCGVESHGLMRTLQYAEQMETGYLRAEGTPQVLVTDKGAQVVDGGGGIGIPAMRLAYDHASTLAGENGLSAVAIRNVGHTGRLGAYAEQAGADGVLTICMGGGNREAWRQVAPYGGAKAMLPTNPWCIGIPGGERGPVVLDFATSKIAGGWIYAARSAGALLPEGCLIDRDGEPTRDPEDYFRGGAILPAGGHKGYGLALMAELIAEAMLGPSTTECHWLLVAIDTLRFREAAPFHAAAEELLAEMRACPPAPGFERVEIPGERERDHRRNAAGTIAVPEPTWRQILDLAARLGVVPAHRPS
jgi:LDH2 family malate/lactate/ureidoglycolate dehydrogenase